MDELVGYIREAVDKKTENMRRRRRRDALRLQLVRVLKKIAENGTFGTSPCVLERESMALHPTFVEYMDGARLYLEMETDKDNSSIHEVKLHFCDFIRIMIKNFSRKFRQMCSRFHKNNGERHGKNGKKLISNSFGLIFRWRSWKLCNTAVKWPQAKSVQFVRILEWTIGEAVECFVSWHEHWSKFKQFYNGQQQWNQQQQQSQHNGIRHQWQCFEYWNTLRRRREITICCFAGE